MTFFDEIKAYVRFRREDAAALTSFLPVVAPELERFAEHFYDVILEHPRAAATLSGGRPQLERLKRSLIDWMESSLRGPHDEAYYEKRSRIGRVHVQIGLAQEFMLTAMNVLRLDFRDAVVTAYPEDRPRALAVCGALDKLFDLELAIMLHHYQLDSESRLLQRERRVQADKLAAMQTLTAGLAHEVRNPLNAAKLQLELLERRLRRSTDDPRLLESTRMVHQEIERLTDLLNEFLDFARPAQLAGADHDLVAIVRHVLELESAAASDRGAELALVNGGAPVVAWVDAGKIHQVVLNLVRNAIEAVEPGGRVEVEVGPVSGGAHIVVRDDGPGISPGVLARIWEPFFSTKDGGTGMGMSIVHSLIDLHRGTIDVRTAASGSEFEVTLRRNPDVAV